jgi:hypothetical protein
MIRLFNLFRPLQRRNKPKYQISTDLLLPSFVKFSQKAKSLAALIRKELDAYTAVSNTPNIMTTILELSAENMESVALMIDPIVEDMNKNETIDLATVSCSIGQLLTHINRETFPNIVTISEFIYTNSGDDGMVQMYDDYKTMTTKTTPSDSLIQAISRDVASSQCLQLDINGNPWSETTTMKMESVSANSQARSDDIVVYLSTVGKTLLFIVVLIVFYPISFIVSIVTIVFTIFFSIILIIFEIYDCGKLCDLDSFILVLGTIALPVTIPFLLVVSIIALFVALLSPILPSPVEPPPTFAPGRPPFTLPPIYKRPPMYTPSPVFVTTEPTPVTPPFFVPVSPPPVNTAQQNNFNKRTGDLIYALSIILKSPMERMVHTMNGSTYTNKETTKDAELQIDCELESMMCQSNALMDALPF